MRHRRVVGFFAAAITAGVDPHGREFHYYMPRWTMSAAEMDALLAHLRAL